jgi:hypothetical protein
MTWLSRFRRPSAAAVRTEAQIDLRDGLLEARADRIAELERDLAIVRGELATYKTVEFMRWALRLRRRQAESPTVILPRRHR